MNSQKLRLPAEEIHAAELEALVKGDDGARPPNWYLVFALSGRGDAEAETDPANPTLASLCPLIPAGRVSLDRYQDLEIDLRECSITRQKKGGWT